MSDHPHRRPAVPKFNEQGRDNSGRNRERSREREHDRRNDGRNGDRRHRGDRDYERRDLDHDYGHERSSHSSSSSSSSCYSRSDKWNDLTPKSYNSSSSSFKRGIRVEAPRLPPRSHHQPPPPLSSTRSTGSSASAYTPLRLFAERGTPAISSSEWESATPLREDETDIERDWYDGADVGDSAVVDASHHSLQDYESSSATLQKKLTAKQAAFVRDNDRWEQNRLQMIGGQRRKGFDASEDDDHQRSQVQLILHDCLPPFMRPGQSHAFLGPLITGSSNQGDQGSKAIVEPFRDSTSDLAIIARKGSPAVKAMRERRERKRLMKTLEGSSTTLGNLMGKREETEEIVGDHSTLQSEDGVPGGKTLQGKVKNISSINLFL